MSTPETKPKVKTASVEMAALALLAVVFLGVSLFCQFVTRDPQGHYSFTVGSNLRGSFGIILAAGLTLVMYSFLYRDNALFKIAENLYVGVSLGYGVVLTWRQALRPDVYDKFFNAPTWDAFREAVVYRSAPVLLGILLITRLSRKHGWMSRYSYALMVGWGAGVGIPLATDSFILKQLYAGIAPLQDAVVGKTAGLAMFSGPWFMNVAFPVLAAVAVVIGTVAVLFYFFYSIEHKRAGRVFSTLGVFFLMVSFGASFGYTVMGRVSLLIGRVQFLLFDWLKIQQ